MILEIEINDGKFNQLLELFELAGESTRLRLARYILSRDGASLDVLLSLFDLLNRQRWHECHLYNLQPRLCNYLDEPELYVKLSSTLECQNDMQVSVALKVLTKIGNREVVPLVYSYLACSTPWIGWPAIELITTLGLKEDWVAVDKRTDWRKNENCIMKETLEKEIALRT